MAKNIFDKHVDCAYVIFRILVGFMFFQHGAMKVFGWYTDGSPMTGLMLVVGILELVGGLAVLLGVFTRLAAAGGALLMLIAFCKAHFPSMAMWTTLNVIGNRGESALLYFAAFLVIATQGSKKLSLEKKLFGKERF